MDLDVQCYIPSFKVIGPVVIKKIFEMAAILVKWPEPQE